MHTGWIARMGLLALVAGGLTLSASGHDEDWRKLRDREEAFVGPIVTIDTLQHHKGAPQPDMFDSENMIMLAWIPLSEFPGGHGSGNDCWGYTSPSGREYAIMGLQKGYGFVEVTDPASPVLLDVVTGPSSSWHDIKIIGHYAYGVSEAGSGIQVIDLSRIDEGIVRHVTDKTQAGHSSTHNIVANPGSGYLYLAGANIANGGLVAVDTVDPENPTIVGQWSDMYVHDAQVVSYDSGPYAGREIAFCLSGFSGGWSSTGLRIVDVTDKSNMFTISEAFWSGAGYSHQGWLSEDRRYIYINDELDEDQGSVSVTTTRIFNVEDLGSPSFVGTFTSGSTSIDHNLYTRGDRIYEANYRSGLRIFDASDPTQPVQVAYFDTYPGSDSANFNGAWSCYPYFDSGTILISDIERGLFLVRELDSGAYGVELQLVGDPKPTLAPAGESVQVEVIETTGALASGSVTLHVRDAGGDRTVAMSSVGAGVYEGDFGALPCFETIEYWFTAETTAGDTVTAPVGAPFITYDAKVLTDLTQIVSDDFETDKGWSVENIDLLDGAWERGVPAGFGDRGDPTTDADGSGRCWLTGNRSGNSDVDGGPTRLTSPIYDLSGADEANISYARWFTNDDGDGDRLDVHVSNDGGVSWTLVESVAGQAPEWITSEFRVADFVPPTSQVRLRFSATDNPNDSVTEAGIDALSIFTISCGAACRVDLTGDGLLDFFDFLEFQNLFGAGDLAADFTGDGVLDFFDFLAFQNEFAAGCP